MNTSDGAPTAGGRCIRSLVFLAGLGAIAAMTIFTVAQPDNGLSRVGIPLAGSGDAPANTTYTQPVPNPMKVGNTATTPAPTSAAGRAG